MSNVSVNMIELTQFIIIHHNTHKHGSFLKKGYHGINHYAYDITGELLNVRNQMMAVMHGTVRVKS